MCYTASVPKRVAFSMIVTVKLVKHFNSHATTVRRVFRYTRDPQCTAGLRCDLTQANTHTTNTEPCCQASVPVELIKIQGNKHFFILVDVIQSSARFNCGSSISVQQKIYAYSADTSKWRCHNCSCGKTVLEKLAWYHTTFKISQPDVLGILFNDDIFIF